MTLQGIAYEHAHLHRMLKNFFRNRPKFLLLFRLLWSAQLRVCQIRARTDNDIHASLSGTRVGIPCYIMNWAVISRPAVSLRQLIVYDDHSRDASHWHAYRHSRIQEHCFY
jgi:hypothetical protein